MKLYIFTHTDHFLHLQLIVIAKNKTRAIEMFLQQRHATLQRHSGFPYRDTDELVIRDEGMINAWWLSEYEIKERII